MKVSSIRDDYEETTGVVSELVRKLAFAGIGVIWILRIGGEASAALNFPPRLLPPLCLFLTALAADLLQYVSKAAILWGLNTYFWRKYRDDEREVTYSGWWNVPGNAFFVIKTVFVLLSFGLLFREIAHF